MSKITKAKGNAVINEFMGTEGIDYFESAVESLNVQTYISESMHRIIQYHNTGPTYRISCSSYTIATPYKWVEWVEGCAQESPYFGIGHGVHAAAWIALVKFLIDRKTGEFRVKTGAIDWDN